MSEEPTDPAATTVTEPLPPRPAIACPNCGARIEGDQGWCTECGLAARTRIADTPNWKLPVIFVGLLGLGAIVALIVAFVVLTGDNAPVPQTTPTTAPPADTVPTTSVPITTTPTTTPATVPTTPVTTTPTVPTATTPTTPAPGTSTIPGATVPTTPTTTPTTPTTGGGTPAPVPND